MIVLTGGAGFIGSNLLRALNAAGHRDIVVVDNLSNADKCRNLNRRDFVDLIDKTDFLDRIDDLGPIDLVLHQGACSSTTESDGRYLLHNNIDYSKYLLDWCQAKGTRFIYASSASVYGNGDAGFSDADPTVEYPLNGYAFSKWAFDQHVRRLATAGSLTSQVVGLRYFNVYGPNEWHKAGMCSPVLHFHRQIQEHGELRLFAGSDGFRRDFIHVDDCCAVVDFFIQHPEHSGIFNCGTGSAASFQAVAEAMVGHYDGGRIVEVPFPDHLKGKYQAYTCADLERLRAIGCNHAFLPLETGVGRYVDLLQSAHGGYHAD